MTVKLTAEDIEAARSAKGGFDRATLANWGVPWPPPTGWVQMLIDGIAIPQPGVNGEPATRARPSACPEAKLLHDVVMAVIESGNGVVLENVEGLNAYYGKRAPTVADVIGGRPLNAVITGGITLDDAVYSFTCSRPVR